MLGLERPVAVPLQDREGGSERHELVTIHGHGIRVTVSEDIHELKGAREGSADVIDGRREERPHQRRFARVTEAVGVAVFLRRVRQVRAVVAHVSPPVIVPIPLIDVGHARTVVTVAAEPILVGVIQCVKRTRVAGVPHGVEVGVLLRGVRHGRTVVAKIAHPVSVRVGLRAVGDIRTVVDRTGVGGEPRITEAVLVGVGARIAGVGHAVLVGILLRRIVDRAVVARVAYTISVRVRLRGIGLERTVVGGTGIRREARLTEAVLVGISAGIAGIARSVVVPVGLGRVEGVDAVVARVADTIRVPVGLGGVGQVGTVIAWAGARGESRFAVPIPIDVRAEIDAILQAIVIAVRERATVQEEQDTPSMGDDEVGPRVGVEIGRHNGGRARRRCVASARNECPVAAPQEDWDVARGAVGCREIDRAVAVQIGDRNGMGRASQRILHGRLERTVAAAEED